jgi:hypothetical protein
MKAVFVNDDAAHSLYLAETPVSKPGTDTVSENVCACSARFCAAARLPRKLRLRRLLKSASCHYLKTGKSNPSSTPFIPSPKPDQRTRCRGEQKYRESGAQGDRNLNSVCQKTVV